MLSHIDRALHEGFDAFEYQIPVNGAKHSFETRMVRHTDSEVIAIIRNVTERKRREDQRNALQLLRREVLNMHGVDDINTVLAVLKKLLEDVGINFKDGCINIIDNVENLSVIAHPLTIDQKWRHTVIPEAAGIIFQIWRDGEPYYRRDLDESDVYNERIHLQSLWKEARSVIDIPFSHGTLSLYNSIPDAFPKDDILFLQDVSQILSEGFRRAEDLQQLALSESRYRTLVETPLNQVVVLITASGNIIYISPQITDLTGYGPEEFSANPSLFRQCFDPVDIRRILRLYCKALHGKLSPDHEIDIFHKNGDRRWVSMNSIPIVGKSSEIEAIQFIIHNITDLKNAEQALRDSEERYQHLYDYSPDIYFTVAKDGSILSVNRFGLDSLGYDRDEIVGRKIWTLAANTEQEQVYDKITAIFADRIMNMELECRLQKKDGTLFWVQELTNLIIDDNNYPSELRVSCRDITDRIMAEEQIQKSLEEKEILLKEIHHRVKNNMQVISSLLALQKERISDEFYGAMFKESINRIQTMALIHELLYRSDNFSQIDFKEYVSRIGSYLSNLYNTQSGGVFLTTDVDDIFLKLDVAIPCGLVINELISNAYKYAFIPSGNGVLTVSMKQKEPSSILLVVADDGCGMPQDFDIDTTESLGLKMVKLLVEYQLGGKLYLKKTPGTTFTIEFTV